MLRVSLDVIVTLTIKVLSQDIVPLYTLCQCIQGDSLVLVHDGLCPPPPHPPCSIDSLYRIASYLTSGLLNSLNEQARNDICLNNGKLP